MRRKGRRNKSDPAGNEESPALNSDDNCDESDEDVSFFGTITFCNDNFLPFYQTYDTLTYNGVKYIYLYIYTIILRVKKKM